MPIAPKLDVNDEQIRRVRQLCADLPNSSERLSHGTPTFFAGKVYAHFADNIHGDGHVAVWLPVPPGEQKTLIEGRPKTFFHPPYVGVKGWIGIKLAEIDDEQLAIYVHDAWMIVTKASRKPSRAIQPRASVTSWS